MPTVNNQHSTDDIAPGEYDIPPTPTDMREFGGPGYDLERRPAMITLFFAVLMALGFIAGALFTLGVLSGYIEIDPKAIKTVIKSLLGKH
jgi:hypothetical protein